MLEDFLPPENNNNSEPTELTEEQKALIIKTWNAREKNPPSLKELCEMCFGAAVDGRDKRAKLIKQFLATRSLKAKVSYEYIKKEEIELTDEEKELIANQCSKMNAMEIGEVLFHKKLSNLSGEVRAINAYIKTLDDRVKYVDPDSLITEKYKAPQTERSMIDRINKYIDKPIDSATYAKNDKQQRWVKALIGYINCYRFIHTVNTYDTIEDRELFESSFISYVYGKDDLLAEERDQYIMLSSEVVSDTHIMAQINKYERIAEESINGDDNSRKLSMSIVEQISNLRKEHNDCSKRQQSLIDDLKGKRSARLKDKLKENESVVQLVVFWKNEETRQRLLQAGEMRRAKLKDEVKRLEDMDSLKFEIYGCDPNELLNN